MFLWKTGENYPRIITIYSSTNSQILPFNILSAFIVKYLEEKSCEYQLEAGWVHQLMIDIGIPSLKILELYDRMFKSKASYFTVKNNSSR